MQRTSRRANNETLQVYRANKTFHMKLGSSYAKLREFYLILRFNFARLNSLCNSCIWTNK